MGQKDQPNSKLFYDFFKTDSFEKNLTAAIIVTKLVLNDDYKVIVDTL